MHELSVCMQLVRQVERLAADHRARTVERIVVQVGRLSGVEPDLLARAFPLAVPGTRAAGAVLSVEALPVRIRCGSCGTEADAEISDLSCPGCGAWRTELLSGRELILKTVEFTVEDQSHV